MASPYQALIDYALLNESGLNVVYDFSTMDSSGVTSPTFNAPTAGAAWADVTFATAVLGPLGAYLDGTEEHEQNPAPTELINNWFFVLVPAISSSDGEIAHYPGLWYTGTTTALKQRILGLGTPDRNTATAMTPDVVNVMAAGWDKTTGFYGAWSTFLGTKDQPPVYESGDNKNGSSSNTNSSKKFRIGTGYKGTIGLMMGFTGRLSEARLRAMTELVGVVGVLSLPTNLPEGRDQVVFATSADDGAFRGRGQRLAGETNVTINLDSATGESLKFCAVDSNPAKDIWASEQVDPLAITSLDFIRLDAAADAVPATQESKVSGVVRIDGAAAQRNVRAFGYDPTNHDIGGTTVNLSKSLGQSRSSSETGTYTIDLMGGYGSEVFVVAFDEYGEAFTSEKVLAAGDRIHPTTPSGHVWECVGAGALPADEPAWVVDTESAQLYGTASMIARPFYRPMVHGPVMPEVTALDPAP